MLRPDQDWCLACGAAVTTRVAAPRGWRVPIAVAAGLIALAAIAVLLALLTLSRGPEQVAEVTATPTPAASAIPQATTGPGAPEGEGPAATPAPGSTPAPTATVPPATAGQQTTPTTPGASPITPATPAAPIGTWPAGRAAWTIVLESNPRRAGAEKVAKDLQAQGVTVGILRSDEHRSLRKGYWVVFSGQYDSRKAAEDALKTLPGSHPDAYARRVSAT
jgi:septal ring-binding cell division protein DamX